MSLWKVSVSEHVIRSRRIPYPLIEMKVTIGTASDIVSGHACHITQSNNSDPSISSGFLLTGVLVTATIVAG